MGLGQITFTPHLYFGCGDTFFGHKNSTMFKRVLEPQIGMMIVMSIVMMMTDCDDHAKNDQGPCNAGTMIF